MEGFLLLPRGVKMNRPFEMSPAMPRPFVSLNPEITRQDANRLMRWLDDDLVTRHLSDSRNVSRFIEQAIERVPLPILTHLFNQGGRFFMACDRDDTPVGFVRLVPDGQDCEMVVVIGDRDHWGRQLGVSTIRAGMKLAFFDVRARRLVARIHPDNVRSLKAFERCGFVEESRTPELTSMVMTPARYLKLLREDPASHGVGIHITELDQTRLRDRIALEDASAVFELEHELERAIVVAPQQVRPDVVTMKSRAQLQVDDDGLDVALVYPEDGEGSGLLSVCSDLGTAILGCKEGDAFDWRIDARTRRVRIGKVLYQPEAAGHFHL